MLDSLQIKDFQCHSKTRVDFDQITTIIGRTDSGKSAVIRALRWLMLNQPRGSDFIRTGEDECAVRLQIDGRSVVRRKGQHNEYLLDGHDFQSFGSTVPDTIKKVLQVDELNFQDQHDAPFWVSLSPSEVSRRMNSIVDLTIVDESLGRSKLREKGNRDRLGFHEEELERADRDVENLDWTEECNTALSAIEETRDRLYLTSERRGDLDRSLQQTDEQRESVRYYRAKVEYLRKIEEDVDRLKWVRYKVLRIEEILRDLDELASRPYDIEKVEKAIDESSSIERTIKKRTSRISMIGKLCELIDDIDQLTDIVYDGRIAVDLSMKELADATEGVCPVCGGEYGS